MEEEVVKEEPVGAPFKEPVKEETAKKEEIAQQPPTQKGGLLCKLRELRKKVSCRQLCMS